MRNKLIPLIAIAFVVALISTAIFYSLIVARATAAPPKNAESVGTVQNNPDAESPPVPKGMRAVTVHVSDSSGVVELLKRGDRVDVQVFDPHQLKAGHQEMKTLLRGVPVLAVHAQPEQSSQGYFSAPAVTLLAQASDAERLALADSYARLRLALRNPHEFEEGSDSGSVRQLVLKVVSLDATGRSALARQLSVPLESRLIRFATAAKPVSLKDAHLEAESRLSVAAGKEVIYDVPAKNGQVQLRFTFQADALHVGAEVRSGLENGKENRRAAADVQATAGQTLIVSGIDRPGETRHLVALITPLR